jgi:hypothetical protein
MTSAKLQAVLESLTNLEAQALLSAFKSSHGNGHDFGYSDDVKVPGCSAQQNGALVSNLLKKGLFSYDSEFDQIQFREFDLPDHYQTARQVSEWLVSVFGADKVPARSWAI